MAKPISRESYGYVERGELFVRNMNIQEYSHGNINNHDPLRIRKLLLQRRELNKIEKSVKDTGITLVPLLLFINERGLAKVEIGVCRGKKMHDKRHQLKEKSLKREMDWPNDETTCSVKRIEMKILMVCLGNICRSPMAEGIMRDLLDGSAHEVDSAGTSSHHEGERPDARMLRTAKYGSLNEWDSLPGTLMETGCLYLIPSLIADVPPLEVIPLSVKKVVDSTQHFIAENEKSGRAFIKKIVLGKIRLV